MAGYEGRPVSQPIYEEKTKEGNCAGIPETFSVICFFTTAVNDRTGRPPVQKFEELCDYMLQKESRKIAGFIRERPDDECDKNWVFVSLVCSKSSWIILKETPEGFEAQVCSLMETDLKNAKDWLYNLAKKCGYQKENEDQGAKSEKFVSGKNDAVLKEKVTLPSSVFEKFREAVASIFRCCVCPGEKNVEEAYEPTAVNGQLNEGGPRGADHVKVENLPGKIKQTEEISSFRSEEVPEKASPQSSQPIQKRRAPMFPAITPYYELLLRFIAESLQFEEITKLKTWAAKKFQLVTALEEKSAIETLRELEHSNAICPTDMNELKVFSSDILRFDIVHAIDCYHDGDYTLLTSGVTGWNGATTARSTFPSRRENSGNVDIQGSSLIVGASRNEQLEATYERVVSQKGANGNVFGNGNSNFGNSGSNGKKLSKPVAVNPDADSSITGPWLCSHYKRRCYVKFDCCNQFWPCHRCHNNESKCGKKKLRSRDTKFVKCTVCNTEQQFDETSQFCCHCNLKFAEYFCAPCKHLTGYDDLPYHCLKCGICRIHSDRSFHCDVCGVCLDKQLLNNHKCRAGSAHDECCICLEDAFTGCQILPCSHKVHKDCASLMIRNGITRCPICRESFAHRLERRPIKNQAKTGGKQ